MPWNGFGIFGEVRRCDLLHISRGFQLPPSSPGHCQRLERKSLLHQSPAILYLQFPHRSHPLKFSNPLLAVITSSSSQSQISKLEAQEPFKWPLSGTPRIIFGIRVFWEMKRREKVFPTDSAFHPMTNLFKCLLQIHPHPCRSSSARTWNCCMEQWIQDKNNTDSSNAACTLSKTKPPPLIQESSLEFCLASQINFLPVSS